MTHVVQPGETLWRISRNYGTTVQDLALANGLADTTRLDAGQKLLIPGKPVRTPTEPAAPRPVEGVAAPLDWPLVGVLYAKFGVRGESRHDGIDIAAPKGTAIRAAGDGTVIFSGEQRGYGAIVILEHAGGLITLYAQNDENLVRDGDRVTRGMPIARVGESSRTSGPHLHFEVREATVPRDPLKYLPPPR